MSRMHIIQPKTAEIQHAPPAVRSCHTILWHYGLAGCFFILLKLHACVLSGMHFAASRFICLISQQFQALFLSWRMLSPSRRRCRSSDSGWPGLLRRSQGGRIGSPAIRAVFSLLCSKEALLFGSASFLCIPGRSASYFTPHGITGGSPDRWPHRSCDKPLRLLFSIRRARGARGRIVFSRTAQKPFDSRQHKFRISCLNDGWRPEDGQLARTGYQPGGTE